MHRPAWEGNVPPPQATGTLSPAGTEPGALPENHTKPRCFHVSIPRTETQVSYDQGRLTQHPLPLSLPTLLTLRILISFPSSVWDLARFFLLMHLTATSRSCF